MKGDDGFSQKKTLGLLEEFPSKDRVKYRSFYRKFYCKNIGNYDNKFDRYDRLHVVSRLSSRGNSIIIATMPYHASSPYLGKIWQHCCINHHIFPIGSLLKQIIHLSLIGKL